MEWMNNQQMRRWVNITIIESRQGKITSPTFVSQMHFVAKHNIRNNKVQDK
jgi:hypothetical protein